jgi:hypothetical protein
LPDLLCLSHQGVRCGIPLRRILAADRASASEDAVCLWRRTVALELDAPHTEERAFQLTTGEGPRWIRGSSPTLHSVPSVDVWRLTPLLRELIPLPHVVGVAEIAGTLVWLVDPTRFSPVAVQVNTPLESTV